MAFKCITMLHYYEKCLDMVTEDKTMVTTSQFLVIYSWGLFRFKISLQYDMSGVILSFAVVFAGSSITIVLQKKNNFKLA